MLNYTDHLALRFSENRNLEHEFFHSVQARPSMTNQQKLRLPPPLVVHVVISARRFAFSAHTNTACTASSSINSFYSWTKIESRHRVIPAHNSRAPYPKSHLRNSSLHNNNNIMLWHNMCSEIECRCFPFAHSTYLYNTVTVRVHYIHVWTHNT